MFSRLLSGAKFDEIAVFLGEMVGFVLIADAGVGGRVSRAGSKVKDGAGVGECRGVRSKVIEDAGAGEYGGVGSTLTVDDVLAFCGVGYMARADAGDGGCGRAVGSKLAVDTRREGDIESHLRFFEGIGGADIFVDAVFFFVACCARWWA